MRSIALKLTLAFLLVAVIAVALIGIFVNVRTQSAFDRFMADRNQLSLTNMLQSYYETNGSWQGVDSVFSRDRFDTPQFDLQRWALAVLDSEHRPIYRQGESEPGRRSLPWDKSPMIPLEVKGETVGWISFNQGFSPIPRRPFVPEEMFLERMVRAILYGGLGAIALALLLGVVLARNLARPIHELTAATQAVAKGELGKQVAVRSKDELGQLATSFNQMSADLARSSKTRRQMTADIAHELRTPLSIMLGYTEALRDGKLQGTPETFDVMHDTTKDLSRLVDDLRTLALADSGELTLNCRPVDPRVLLERAALAQMTQAEAKGISLVLNAPADMPEVEADPTRISQVLTNLVSNAIRHTPQGGEIVLSGEVEAGPAPTASGAQVIPGYVRLQVSDTGVGIASEDLPFVFERFYRGDKSRKQDQGESGLGLAIARSIVETHGGSIKVASAFGEGATFSILLPVA